MTRLLWILLGSATAACGGNVVFVEDGGAGGGGSTGDGGAPGTTSNTTAATTQTTVNTTSQATTDAATTSVGGGAPNYVCAFGQGNESCNRCFEDAQATQCSSLAEDCANDPSCFNYDMCIVGCGNQEPCCQDCAATFPVGAKLYSDAAFCLACESCPECSEVLPGFCP